MNTRPGDHGPWWLLAAAAVVLVAGVARWVAMAPEPVHSSPAPPSAVERSVSVEAPGPDEAASAAAAALARDSVYAVLGGADTLRGEGTEYGTASPISPGRYVLQVACVGAGHVVVSVYENEDPDGAGSDGPLVATTDVACTSEAAAVGVPVTFSQPGIFILFTPDPETVGGLAWQLVSA